MSLNPFTADAPELPDWTSDIVVERFQREGYVLIWRRIMRYKDDLDHHQDTQPEQGLSMHVP